MINTQWVYNSDLLKGTGLIQETLLLLDIYEPGIPKADLIKKVIESNVLVRNHPNRIKDIVNHTFFRRYLKQGEDTVTSLKLLREKHVSLDILNQIFLIYTCRANLILFDFIRFVYQKLIKEGASELPGNAAKAFIDEAIIDGNIEKAWADSTKRKVSEHINASMIDFKLINRQRKILPFFPYDFVANYLVHQLHFSGLSDEAILNAKEWELFGYNRHDTLKHLERLSFQGNFILQSSGEIVRITWNYQNMNELIDAA
ncbi:BrxA family protein [Pontibacter toksunensis]|uniref:BrxA family protein n=1 Tax=Pontibacter toksunensis TaxID=1332631 RepID=A0ABW6BRH0_9BACT